MYETMTYEGILQRMLDRVPESVDKREGSIIYDALAPAAAEMMQMYIALDGVLDETFADTASREYLIKRAAERGLSPKPATAAELKAESNIDVPMGSRFTLNGLVYRAEEKLGTGVCRVVCETAGSQGSDKLGVLTPVTYIEGCRL